MCVEGCVWRDVCGGMCVHEKMDGVCICVQEGVCMWKGSECRRW